MKRFYVVDNDVVGVGKPDTLAANQLGIYRITPAWTIQSAAPGATVDGLQLALGNSDGVGFHDLGRMSTKDLRIAITKYKAAQPVNAVIEVTATVAPIVNMDYTIFVNRQDVVMDQRWRRTVTYRAVANDTWDIVLADLTKQLNAIKRQTGLTAVFTAAVTGATPAAAKITITGPTTKITPFAFKPGDTLHGAVKVTQTGAGITATGDVADILDQLFESAQTRGADNTYMERQELYPFLNTALLNTQYDVYTFRFYNERTGSRTVDEPLFQLLHLAVKTGGNVATRLNTVFANFIK